MSKITSEIVDLLSEDERATFESKIKKIQEINQLLPDISGAEKYISEISDMNRWDVAIPAYCKFSKLDSTAQSSALAILKKAFPTLEDLNQHEQRIKDSTLIGYKPNEM